MQQVPQVSVVRWLSMLLVGGALVLVAVGGAPRVALMLFPSVLVMYVWSRPDWLTLAFLGVWAVGIWLGWPWQWGADEPDRSQQIASVVTLAGFAGAFTQQVTMPLRPRRSSTYRRPAPKRRRRGRKRPGRRAHRRS